MFTVVLHQESQGGETAATATTSTQKCTRSHVAEQFQESCTRSHRGEEEGKEGGGHVQMG